MRSLVRLLGALVGETIAAHEGETAFGTVETLRRGFVELRRAARRSPAAVAKVARTLDHVGPETATTIGRAFAVYFSLVNIAEEAMRERDRRDAEWPRSFDETLSALAASGVDAAAFRAKLPALSLVPVFTAHPTEARRQAVQKCHRRLFDLVGRLIDVGDDHRARTGLRDELRDEIQILWKTSPLRAERLTVADEIANGLLLFRSALFDAVPQALRSLADAAARTWGPALGEIDCTGILSFGSWIGGDRDGNPNVTAEVTIRAGREQSREVLREYIRRIDALMDRLTQSSAFVRLDPGFAERLAADEAALAAVVFADRASRFEHEPFRRKLAFMRHRLAARLAWTEARLLVHHAEPGAGAYASAAELAADIRSLRDALVADGGERLARGALQDLLVLVQVFGFHLARLDLRQEAGRHAAAVTEILDGLPGLPRYGDLDEATRLDILLDLILKPGPVLLLGDALSAQTQETLASLRAVRVLQDELGAAAVESYVVSMADRASAVVEVLFLARLVGLVEQGEGGLRARLRVAPLFETAADLAAAPAIIAQLLDRPAYRRLLASAGGTQEVMLGYSDSCKDAGILGSAWALHQAQVSLAALLDQRDVPYLLFHGRGGSHARGGGPTYDAIQSGPPQAANGRLKFTEQGEVLSFKYANRPTAVYELTVALSGLVKASFALAEARRHVVDARFAGAMARIAAIGEASYRDLVAEDAGLLDFFYEATPVLDLAALNIGSRPSHRPQGGRSLRAIRAIPWVFGWSQARLALPAWYGVGSALQAFAAEKPGNLAVLRRMCGEWPYLRHVLDNAQMALAKTDLAVAQLYVSLASDREAADRIWKRIKDECVLTERWLKRAMGTDRLLAENRQLAFSLDRRAPYIDAVNALQARLIARSRQPDGQTWRHPLLLSINAIAAGMRNTG
ncbi:MAG: phosphoenolpyruvate carboxylase [Alphaproteobacteria bacterium]|nr:phosphoenolpyruvate carboxylase [Alphaproteobacteria bacterium]